MLDGLKAKLRRRIEREELVGLAGWKDRNSSF